MQQRQLVDDSASGRSVSSMMIEKIIVVDADDRGADEHRLRRRLERVAGAVVLLEQILRLVELDVEAEVAS